MFTPMSRLSPPRRKNPVLESELILLAIYRWSVGSLLFLASFAAVMGPMNYVYHLCSTPRLPFTAAYFGSITMTLLFALKVRPLRLQGGSTQIFKDRKRQLTISRSRLIP
jgi:hypothetical protein